MEISQPCLVESEYLTTCRPYERQRGRGREEGEGTAGEGTAGRHEREGARSPREEGARRLPDCTRGGVRGVRYGFPNSYLGGILEEVTLGRPEAKDLGRVLPPLKVREEEGRVKLLLGDRM